MKRKGYPTVEDGHIVPTAYLRNFANEKQRIRVVPVDGSRARDRPVRKAGTRKFPYRRVRPTTGEEIHDVEASLQVIEGLAAPVLRNVAGTWPLGSDERSKLGQFCAIQLVRSPAWMEWYDDATRDQFERLRVNAVTTGSLTQMASHALALGQEHQLSASSRLTEMLLIYRKVSAIFLSMCWTLVEFPKAVIATSDQPIVSWPLGESEITPGANPFLMDVIETLELRVPLSPTHILLMSWSINPEDEGRRVEGAPHHAANVNALTIAAADRDWFHLPSTTPPDSHGPLIPISTQLLQGYEAAIAATSHQRAELSRAVNAMSSNLEDDDIPVIKVSTRRREVI